MFNYDYGRRLDHIDYENMGTSSRWYIRNTILLLTSFEMEEKKYFDREDRADIYSRIYDRFDRYIWDCFIESTIEFYDGLSDDDRERSRLDGAIKSFDLDRGSFKQDDILGYIDNNNRIKVDIINLKRFLVGEDVPELEGVVSINVGNDKRVSKAPIDKGAKVADLPISSDPFYEDVISDETILKLKELPLPKMKQQVAILAAEKKKNDATIIACAKIGLLFYELGLTKPTTKELFVSEYMKHLDMLPILPVATIQRLYRHLPGGYRRTTDGGQVAIEKADVDPIIMAAVLAGAQSGDRASMNVKSLSKSLAIEGYAIPDDGIMEKIIAAVMKLEVEENE